MNLSLWWNLKYLGWSGLLCALVLFAACAGQTPTDLPKPTPTTQVIIVVATDALASATNAPSAAPTQVRATAVNTPAVTETIQATSTLTPTRAAATPIPATATRVPPTELPPATAAPATQPPTLAPTLAPTQAPTEPPTVAPTDAPSPQPVNPQNIQPPASFAPTELVLIPEGVLKMGGKAQEDDPDEKPFHDVPMYEYRIEKYEVTNAQYQACAAAGACPAPTKSGSFTRATYFGDPAFANFPVVNVTWHGAEAYCKWIGRRLPNEGEWERAAKGTENWRYTWSNSIGMHFEWNAIFHGSPISFCEASCPIQNYWGDVNDGFPDTAPVGWFSEYDNSSGFGVIDMAGNVAEWTNNWYDGNAYANGNDIYGPGDPTGTKVVRGGSWADEPRRNSDREPQAPEYSSDRIGFRCAQ